MQNVALVGVGHIHTPAFINTLRKSETFKVTRVYDPNPTRAQVRAAELGAEVSSLEAIVGDASITAAVVCSETALHESLVLPLAKAKKHLFVEKPLGMNADDAAKMAAAIDTAGVIFQTGYFSRGHAPVRWLKEKIDAGFFGKITRVRGSNVHPGALGGWFDDKPADPANSWRWMADPKQSGCGGFGDLGTHYLDLLIWFCGDVASVSGQIDNATNRYGCDETGEALLRFKSGVIGTLAGGWVDYANPVTLQISGTLASASVIAGKIHCKCPSLKIDGIVEDLPEALPHAFDLFLAKVAGENVPLVSASEAAYRNKVMAAIYTAANDGSVVKV